MQKEVRPTQFFRPSGFNEVDLLNDDREDNFDDEASPVKPVPERRQVTKRNSIYKLDNSLDNSNIQMEGEIGSSPQKIHKVPLTTTHLNQSKTISLKASNQFLQNQSKKRDTAHGNGEDSLFERQQNNFIEGLE